ncbi:MAG: ankyrin repeat domain-containing protein [Legionellaceae bacterium]|nr:ankyrin repeat domain-containing protein [Legionellaceae bacterium]
MHYCHLTYTQKNNTVVFFFYVEFNIVHSSEENFFVATRDKNVVLFKKLLSAHISRASIDRLDADGNTALHIAMQQDTTDILSLYFVEKDAWSSFWQKFGGWSSKIPSWARGKNIQEHEDCSDHMQRFFVINKKGLSPIHLALQKQNPAFINLLLDELILLGHPHAERKINGHDVRCAIAKSDNVSVLEKMTKLGAEFNARIRIVQETDLAIFDPSNTTPLLVAGHYGNFKAVKYFLNLTDCQNLFFVTKQKNNIMHFCAEYEDVTVIQELCDKLDTRISRLVNERNSSGYTPLDIAAQRNNYAVVKVLLNKTDNFNAKTLISLLSNAPDGASYYNLLKEKCTKKINLEYELKEAFINKNGSRLLDRLCDIANNTATFNSSEFQNNLFLELNARKALNIEHLTKMLQDIKDNPRYDLISKAIQNIINQVISDQEKIKESMLFTLIRRINVRTGFNEHFKESAKKHAEKMYELGYMIEPNDTKQQKSDKLRLQNDYIDKIIREREQELSNKIEESDVVRNGLLNKLNNHKQELLKVTDKLSILEEQRKAINRSFNKFNSKLFISPLNSLQNEGGNMGGAPEARRYQG